MSTKSRAAYGVAALVFAAAGVTATTGAADASSVWYACGHGWKCMSHRYHSDDIYAGAKKGTRWVAAEYYKNNSYQHLDITDHFANHHKTVAYVKVGGSGTATYYGPPKSDRDHVRHVHLHYAKGKSIKVKVCTSTSSHAVCSHYTPAGRT